LLEAVHHWGKGVERDCTKNQVNGEPAADGEKIFGCFSISCGEIVHDLSSGRKQGLHLTKDYIFYNYDTYMHGAAWWV